MKTSDVLKDMLKENTGRHMLDSGGAYGRHWERNQGRDFDKEPFAVVEFDWYTNQDGSIKLRIAYLKNIYHHLCERLEFHPELDELFREFLETNEETYIDDGVNNFSQFLAQKGFTDVKKLGGYYTYNEENCLSQNFIANNFYTDEHGYFALIQIHGGCDARGGFTFPRAFTLDNEYSPIYDINSGVLRCENEFDHVWYADDGIYNGFKFEGCITDTNLTLFPEMKNTYDPSKYDLDKLEIVENDWQEGKLLIKDKIGYCPICGGKLVA